MRELFLKVQARLKELTSFKYIDMDFGQLDSYTTKPDVQFPCALIRVDLTGCDDLGGGIQRCRCRVTIRLAFNFVKMDTASIYNEARISNALAYFDSVEEAYKALQGFYDAEVEEFSRINAQQEVRDDGLTVLAIPFDTEFDDYTAAKS